MWPTPKSRDWEGGMGTDPDRQLNDLDKLVKLFPTPTGDDAKQVTRASGAFQSLTREVVSKHWPTPTSTERSGTNPQTGRGEGLSKTVKMLPTPRTQMTRRTKQDRGKSNLEEVVGQGINGSLSPDWVSWLMGLPVGWTSLEPMPRREYLDWLHAQLDGTWWDEERGLPRVATGVKDRVNRLKCLGNGIVPASLALFLRR